MKRVVIIGGSFTGSQAAKRLEKRKEFSVTFIDKKDYFEFIPGILRIAVQKDYGKKIRVRHSDYLKKTKIIIGEVKEVERNFVLVGRRKIGFDYLVIASGTKYAPSNTKNWIVSAGNSIALWNAADKLRKAKKVLIIGGGLVGVELAGEICTHYKDKEIIIINKGESLIARNHPKAIKLAHQFLEKQGVKLLLNDEIIDKSGKYFLTRERKRIGADIVFNCIGAIPNSSFMKKKFFDRVDERGSIKVNEFLQVENLGNIFAGGDITAIKEEKTAQSAMKHGKLIAHNIIALEKGERLKEYSHRVRPMVISLGRWNAIFDNKKIVFSGLIPAFMKLAVEKKIIWMYGLFN